MAVFGKRTELDITIRSESEQVGHGFHSKLFVRLLGKSPIPVIGLRENLQETMVVTMTYAGFPGFRLKLSLKPIH